MKLATLDKISCFLAELIGTGLLVFLGCMGCIQMEGMPNSHLQIVINFGLTIMFIIQIFGCVSGAHLNPAVTAAAFIYKLVTLPMAGVYFVAQMLGGFIGFGLLKVVVPPEAIRANNATVGLCTTVPHPSIGPIQAVSIEFLITMVLIMVCCAVWDPRNSKTHDSVSLRFGFTITALACAAGPWTGGSMNPARSFGPAIWNGDFQSHWIYWVGPMASAIVTAITYKAVFWREAPPEKTKMIEEFPLSRDRNNA